MCARVYTWLCALSPPRFADTDGRRWGRRHRRRTIAKSTTHAHMVIRCWFDWFSGTNDICIYFVYDECVIVRTGRIPSRMQNLSSICCFSLLFFYLFASLSARYFCYNAIQMKQPLHSESMPCVWMRCECRMYIPIISRFIFPIFEHFFLLRIVVVHADVNRLCPFSPDTNQLLNSGWWLVFQPSLDAANYYCNHVNRSNTALCELQYVYASTDRICFSLQLMRWRDGALQMQGQDVHSTTYISLYCGCCCMHRGVEVMRPAM